MFRTLSSFLGHPGRFWSQKGVREFSVNFLNLWTRAKNPQGNPRVHSQMNLRYLFGHFHRHFCVGFPTQSPRVFSSDSQTIPLSAFRRAAYQRLGRSTVWQRTSRKRLTQQHRLAIFRTIHSKSQIEAGLGSTTRLEASFLHVFGCKSLP